MFIVSKYLLISSATVIVRAWGAIWLNPFATVKSSYTNFSIINTVEFNISHFLITLQNISNLTLTKKTHHLVHEGIQYISTASITVLFLIHMTIV